MLEEREGARRRPPRVAHYDIWFPMGSSISLAGVRRIIVLTLGMLAASGLQASLSAGPRPPNIILILADDLGYGDLGCYGQTLIRTPELDRMAQEGVRFTHFYAGSTVCAPSRSVLLTGLHGGHTRVRGNAPASRSSVQSLRDEDITFAEVAREAGVRTGLVGKWGLGERDSSGAPWLQGFDEFVGFLNQTHAHNHFPSFLWRGDQRFELPNDLVPIGPSGAGYAIQRRRYANDLFFDEAEQFVARHVDRPFLLFLSLTLPHANNERSRSLGDGQEVPELGEYGGRPWPDVAKGQAAMISRMDAGVGRLLRRLRELGIDEQTLVLFSSDNGPHQEGGHGYTPDFFRASGGLRGIKRDLTEGGIRVPLIARWPGRIAAGRESPHVAYLGDLTATVAELLGRNVPHARDSVSLVPVLLGADDSTPVREWLYWEFNERTFSQALLWRGRWKAIRDWGDRATLRLYDLQEDPGETRDIGAREPELAQRLNDQIDHEHEPSADWPWQRPVELPAASAR